MLPALLASLLAAPAPQPSPAPKSSAAAIFVVPQDTVAQEVTGRVETGLTAALRSKGVELIDWDALAPSPAPPSLAEAEQALSLGRQAYDNLDLEAAADHFTVAAIHFIKHPTETKPGRLAEVFVLLGAALKLNGDDEGAKDAFIRALLFDASAKPGAAELGVDLTESLSAAGEAVRSLPNGRLLIEPLPSGSRVFIGGVDAGLAPLDRELPVGRHHVLITRPGHAPFGTFSQVSEGKTLELRPTLQPTPALAEAQAAVAKLVVPAHFHAPGLPPEAKALAANIGARYLVLVGVTTQADNSSIASLQVWDTHTGDRLRDVRFELDGEGKHLAEAASRVKAWLEGPVLPAKPAATPLALPPVMKKWWFWAAVGGAAAVTVGVVAASRGGPRPDLILGTP